MRSNKTPFLDAFVAGLINEGHDPATFDLPINAGITARYEGGAAEAIARTDAIAARAVLKVRDGELLRLDAVQGNRLADVLGVEVGTLPNGKPIDPDAWYGVVPVLGISTEGYDRKSQAMNAIVLALLGVPVHPTRAIYEAPRELDPVYEQLATTVARRCGVHPDEVRAAVRQGLDDFDAEQASTDTEETVETPFGTMKVVGSGDGFLIVERA